MWLEGGMKKWMGHLGLGRAKQGQDQQRRPQPYPIIPSGPGNPAQGFETWSSNLACANLTTLIEQSGALG